MQDEAVVQMIVKLLIKVWNKTKGCLQEILIIACHASPNSYLVVTMHRYYRARLFRSQ